jgi:hypothetical protein
MIETMKEDVIELHEHIKPEVLRIAILIAHYESSLNGLQQELRRLLKLGMNIDASEPGWHLLPFDGVIVHRFPVVVPESSHEPETEPAEPEAGSLSDLPSE